MRRPLLSLALLAAAVPAASAPARVVVIAGGDRFATLTDVSTNAVVARVALPGRAHTVALAPDGSRAWLGAGRLLVPVDLATRAAGTPVVLRGRVTALAMSPDGTRLLAARRGAIDLVGEGSIPTPGATARALAVSPDGTRVAALAGSRLLVADLQRRRVVRQRRLPGARSLAYSPTGRLWALAAGRLAGRSAIHVGRQFGGGLAISADGRRAYVGAARGFSHTAVIDLRRGRVRARIATGAGPGFPAVAPDGVRVYVGNRALHTIAVLSAVSDRRLGTQRLPRSVHPVAVAV
jgi:DNA-binding beta-propeller fold protein YncE